MPPNYSAKHWGQEEMLAVKPAPDRWCNETLAQVKLEATCV